jgi:hypothetical protein
MQGKKMKRAFLIVIALILALSACGQAPTPEPTSAPTPDMVATMVVEMLTSQPTVTPNPTATPQPSATPTLLPATETPTPTVTATSTSIPFQGTLAPAGLGGTLPVKKFLIENNTSETLHVSIYGVSIPGEKPLYYEYDVTGTFSFDIVWGSFQYTVQVGTKKIFTGNFKINNYDKTVMRVYMTKVVITGP